MTSGRDRARQRCTTYASLLLVALCGAGCTYVVASPPPTDVRAIAVFPIDNRTGSELYADAPPLLGILRDTPDVQRVTAAEILTDAFRRALEARGFAVVAPAALAGGPTAAPVRSAAEAAQRLAALGIDATALYVQLWVWDATSPSHLVYVDVKLDAFLVEPATAAILWRASFPASPVDAGGASSVSLAYPVVAHRVADATIAGLGTAPGRPPPP